MSKGPFWRRKGFFMEDYKFITGEELEVLDLNYTSNERVAGSINKILNEKAQIGYSEYASGHACNGLRSEEDKYETFTFTRPLKEENPSTWGEVQDVLNRFQGCTSCGAANPKCCCEMDD